MIPGLDPIQDILKNALELKDLPEKDRKAVELALQALDDMTTVGDIEDPHEHAMMHEIMNDLVKEVEKLKEE